MNDEPDVPDFIDAIAAAFKGEGIPYLEAQSMVRHMLEEAWESLPDLADLAVIDPPTNAGH
jgi:hypothetical protein